MHGESVSGASHLHSSRFCCNAAPGVFLLGWTINPWPRSSAPHPLVTCTLSCRSDPNPHKLPPIIFSFRPHPHSPRFTHPPPPAHTTHLHSYLARPGLALPSPPSAPARTRPLSHTDTDTDTHPRLGVRSRTGQDSGSIEWAADCDEHCLPLPIVSLGCRVPYLPVPTNLVKVGSIYHLPYWYPLCCERTVVLK